MKQFVLVSLLVHVLILLVKVPESKLQNNKNQNKSTIKVKLKQKEDKQNNNGGKDEDLYIIQDIIDVLQKVEELGKKEIAIKSMLDTCETYYMGIGITHDPWSGQVISVVAGGPADKANIKVGDIILDTLDIRDKHKEGTQITIPVLRDGIMYQIPVIIGKICTKEKENENKKP